MALYRDDAALKKLEFESNTRDKVFSKATGVLWVIEDKHRPTAAAEGLYT